MDNLLVYVAFSLAGFFGFIVGCWCSCYICLWLNEVINNWGEDN